MAKIIPFKKPKASEKHKGKNMCQHGFHKWKVVTEKQFDVKKGQLVTAYQCIRCKKTKVKAH